MIGVFDSGSGGLTVLRALRETMPSADFLYFGDIRNAPYGEKPQAELSTLTVAAIRLLQEQGATSIVSACNSVSASLAVSLFDSLALASDRLIEMVGPTVSAFRGSRARVLLVATPATIRSEIYQNAFRMIGKDIEAVAIPGLAGAIEFGASPEEIRAHIRDALTPRARERSGVLVLACTHYPLVADAFSESAGLPLFDPAEAVAERAQKRWWPREVGDGTLRFLVSADSALFRARVATLFPESADAVEVLE
jgi:glutamate racemase